MQKTTDLFLNFIQKDRRYSTHTIVSYKTDLVQFSHFLKETFDVSAEIADYHMIRVWIAYLIEQKISGRSINRKIATLKSFFRFLMIHGQIEISPVQKIGAVKFPQRLPVYLDEKNIAEVIGKAEQSCHEFYQKRNYLLLLTFYYTGMRLSELINLKETDFDKFSSTVRVIGKGGKQRLIPVNRELLDEIDSYLAEKQKIFNVSKHSIYMFVTQSGKKLYPKLVYRIVNLYLSMTSTVEKRSPHVLRHTFATHLLNAGAELNAIKELLGHASLSATQVYTHNSVEKLKSIYKQAHPKA